MSGKPPSYDDVEYWDKKYKDHERPFEWLLPPHILDDEIKSALKEYGAEKPNILHIGSGSSLMSFALRGIVDDPTTIHNVDFSKEALEWGSQTEESVIDFERRRAITSGMENAISPKLSKRMKWIQASLLSLDSILKFCKPSSYAIFIDKSTSDSISCGDDEKVDSSFPLRTEPNKHCTTVSEDDNMHAKFSAHPLHIMSIYLAYLAQPGAIWIALSYSQYRFDILDPNLENDEEAYLQPELLQQGFPDTKLLWKLENITAIETAEEHQGDNGLVHRPKAFHYMFQLRRTDVQLQMRA
jgi:hypothetical protein